MSGNLIPIIGHIPEGVIWDSPHRVARYMYRDKGAATDINLCLYSDVIEFNQKREKENLELKQFLIWFSDSSSIRNTMEARKRARHILFSLGVSA